MSKTILLAAAIGLAGCTGPFALPSGKDGPAKPVAAAGSETVAAKAAAAGPSAPANPPIMTVDELRPGMKGYGLTVFAGAHPERFEVEVISVLKNYDPQTDMILIRCSGHDLEKTGIAAGMSGSPIYIDGKLIGALAFGWRFTVQPIAGVQPIEQMLRNSGMHGPLPPIKQEEVPDGGASPASDTAVNLSVPSSDGAALRGSPARAKSDPTRLEPLATPLMVSGSSPLAMDLLRERLAGTGLVPLKSGGAGDDPRMSEAKIEPGGTVAIPLLAGDLDMAGIGTVTAVYGDRILAFGHPMFGEGPINAPMAVGVIHTFIPSLQSSFKMGSAGPVVGAIRRDESTAIMGVCGQKPYLSPMTVTVTPWTGAAAKTYHYRLADDLFFTPLVAAFAAVNSATADHGRPNELTVHYSGQIKFKGFETYKFEGIGVGASGLVSMADDVQIPIKLMLNNPWGKALVESVDLEVKTVNENASANLELARMEPTTLAPGEPAELHLTLTPYKKPRFDKTIKVELPADLPDGNYGVSLLDGPGYRRLVQQHNPRAFAPENMPELLATFNRLSGVRDDQYYVVLTLPTGGLATREQRLPSLPASRALILEQAQRDEIKPFTEDRVWAHPMHMVVTGSRQFQVTIDRNKNKRE